ncbi:site-specific integrase [Janthinobacterium sp. 17J80-10]|uniref:tyrosine-type recombinase/integrase n=1 Tax=Janthinobacterium sp. 17J80-10 TaxID=2497863 RepID=UPI001005A463|nr:site-specific integrase [Janthinobacterium sp. 17J80-10]QAU35140.1 site-specific integrase [Janthinobacterium sp. 17J80-10]
MATITKTPSGTWKAVIRRSGWPSAIKTFRTKRDAEDWARGTEDEMVRGVYIQRGPSEKTTIKEALERYQREIVPTKKESTQRREGARMRELTSYFGKYSLAAITPDLIAKFRDFRLAQGKANNTVRLELALLGHLFTVAIKEWHVGLIYNPVANVRKPSPGAGRNRRLTSAEQKKLLEAIDQHNNPMLGWIVRLAIETGMRQSEILGLRRSQIDIGRRIVRLVDTKNDSARTVPLTKAATEVLQQALDNPIRPIDTNLIFFGEPGKTGERRAYQFTKVWNRIKKRLGLADLHFHDLRHEAVSRLVEGGLSDQEVASISGHKSMQMLRRYTHLRAEDLVSRLDDMRVVIN